MANQTLYGFANLEDRFGDRVKDVGEQTVAEAIGLTLENHNSDVADLLSLFAEFTTQHQVNFTSLAASELQDMDQDGRPMPIKSSKYTVAYPLRMGGAATGENFVTSAKMTVGNVNALVGNVLMADLRWIRSHLLRAIFTNTSRSFTDEEVGALTIQPFANGDTVKYVKDGDSVATDDHYLAQANSIDDGADNPFPGLKDELLEHPENSGEVIAFIPNGLKASVQALANYADVSDPNVDRSSIAAVASANGPGVTHPGELIGYVDGVWVVEWRNLPAGYMLATTSDGDTGLRARQDLEAELQGLVLVEDNPRIPHKGRAWYRRLGFGAHNRARVVVKRIGNGTYAIPSGYTAT